MLRLAGNHDGQRRAGQQGQCNGFPHRDLDHPAAVVDAELVTLPLLRQERIEPQLIVVVAHAGEALHDSQPAAGHRGDVQTVCRIVVVVVQVQTSRTLIEFNGLILLAELGGQHRVNRGTQRAFVHRQRLVEVKIAFLLLAGEAIVQEVQALEHIRLLDERRPQDPVPGPVLVDWPLIGWNRACRPQVLIQEGVVLDEDAQLIVLRIVHAVDDVLPLLLLGTAHGQPGLNGGIGLGQPGQRVLQAPGGHRVGVPVVVDVVFVLVRPGDAVDHVLAGALGEVDPVRPEAADAHQHLHAVVVDVAFIAGVGRVLVNREGDRCVTVQLLEGDFPFIVALDAVEGHHREQGPFEPLLLGVVVGAGQLVVPVLQQCPGHGRRGGGDVHRHHVRLGVPVGRPAVLLAGETLRPHVEPLIVAVIGHEQLGEVEADPLLGRVVAFNHDVALGPALGPKGGVCRQLGRKALALQLCHQPRGRFGLGLRGDVAARDHDDVLFQLDRHVWRQRQRDRAGQLAGAGGHGAG